MAPNDCHRRATLKAMGGAIALASTTHAVSAQEQQGPEITEFDVNALGPIINFDFQIEGNGAPVEKGVYWIEDDQGNILDQDVDRNNGVLGPNNGNLGGGNGNLDGGNGNLDDGNGNVDGGEAGPPSTAFLRGVDTEGRTDTESLDISDQIADNPFFGDGNLADGPDIPDGPDDAPQPPEAPEKPDPPEAPQPPAAPEKPDPPEAPQPPEAPDPPEAPEPPAAPEDDGGPLDGLLDDLWPF